MKRTLYPFVRYSARFGVAVAVSCLIFTFLSLHTAKYNLLLTACLLIVCFRQEAATIGGCLLTMSVLIVALVFGLRILMKLLKMRANVQPCAINEKKAFPIS